MANRPFWYMSLLKCLCRTALFLHIVAHLALWVTTQTLLLPLPPFLPLIVCMLAAVGCADTLSHRGEQQRRSQLWLALTDHRCFLVLEMHGA